MSAHEMLEQHLTKYEYYGHPWCAHMPFFGQLAPLKCLCCPHDIRFGCQKCLERKKRVLLKKDY
jgi:hypothetical protein